MLSQKWATKDGCTDEFVNAVATWGRVQECFHPIYPWYAFVTHHQAHMFCEASLVRGLHRQ